MPQRESLYPAEAGADATLLLVDDPEFPINSAKTHGIWILSVSEAVHGEVTDHLRRMMAEEKKYQFVSVMIDRSETGLSGHMKRVFVFDEGALYRRRLGACLRAFEQIGVDGSWIYCDCGADRHKACRRLLMGKHPLSEVNEIDFRKGGDEPVAHEFPVPMGSTITAR